ncbi:MAG TPA: hypothetical protein VMJ64_14955 [Anaerolineales bacterium]|nr:hypothetical protein [Anaerolineales bacterium]
MKQYRQGTLLIVVAVALAAFLAAPARAQSGGGVTMAVEAGFDGYCKEGAWMPVRVTLANDGPDLAGRVQLAYETRYGINDRIQSGELQLPTTSRKELTLYAYPPQSSYTLTVSLLMNGKAVAGSKVTRQCVLSNDMIIGVAADQPGSYDLLKQIDLSQGHVFTAQVHLNDLPPQAQGWETLDGLVISGVDTAVLTDAQRAAMKSWVASGGKLVVIGGPQWQAAAAGLRDLLPVDIRSTHTVANLSALQDYFRQSNAPDGPAIVSVATPRIGATTLVEADGLPLVVRKLLGFGEVLYISADPSLQPLSRWDGMKELYSGLLGTKPARPEWMKTPWDPSSANQALSALRELGLPSTLYVCGWMGLYIAIIGPLNFIILRRRKKGELAWITIPALVVLFSLLAYLYGNVFRGSRPILNRIAVVQAWDGSDQAQVHGLVGVYSPGRAKYSLEADDPFILYPFDNAASASIQSGGTTAVSDLPVEIGGMKAVAVDGSLQALPIRHDLVLTVDKTTAILRGRITNASPYTLRGAMLVTAGDWKSLGDLPPSGYIRVNVSLASSSSGPQFYAQEPMNILNYFPYNGVSDQDMARKLAMLQALLSQRYRGNWGIFLMGWLDNQMLPVRVQGRQFGAIDTALYVDLLDPSVQYKSGAVGITPGLMAWEASADGSGPFSPNYYGQGSGGSYVLRFHPAIPITYKSVARLDLDLDVNAGALPSQVSNQVAAWLWDYEDGQWFKVDNLTWGGLNDIPAPSRYVGPGGEVRLRIEPLANSYLSVSRSTVSLEVDR